MLKILTDRNFIHWSLPSFVAKNYFDLTLSVLSKVFNLDYLSCPQIWNIEQEKDREKDESRWQASEAQRD